MLVHTQPSQFHMYTIPSFLSLSILLLPSSIFPAMFFFFLLPFQSCVHLDSIITIYYFAFPDDVCGWYLFSMCSCINKPQNRLYKAVISVLENIMENEQYLPQDLLYQLGQHFQGNQENPIKQINMLHIGTCVHILEDLINWNLTKALSPSFCLLPRANH